MRARAECPICARATEVIFSRPYQLPELQSIIARAGLGGLVADKSYEVRYCAATDFYFQTWVMEDGELAGFYSSPAGDDFFMGEIAKQKLHWFAHMTEEILVMRQLVAAKVPVVLDFGCNWGKWASMALAHGCDVYAVEVNRDAAAFCARRGIKIVPLDGLKDLRFDFVNVDQVMEHLSEPLPVAQRLVACLKPGGLVKLSTPNNPRLPQLLAAAQSSGANNVLNPQTLDSLAPLEHVNLFSNRALKTLAARVGLRPVRLPFFKWMGAGQMWNLPRQLNRNVITPWKRWRMKGAYLWFQKPS